MGVRPGIVVTELVEVHQQERERVRMTQRLCSAILLALAAMAAVGCTHVTDRYQAAAPAVVTPST
jgi:hypothetical protein